MEGAKKMVTISDKLSCLTGVGEEYYVDTDGNVLLKFYDGMLSFVPKGNDDVTVSMS